MKNFLKNLELLCNNTVRLSDPEVLEFMSDTKRTYKFNKEVEKTIYKGLQFSKTVSKKVYDIDVSIWNQVVDIRSNDSENLVLSNMNYLKYVPSLSIVSMTDIPSDMLYKHIMTILQSIDKFDRVDSNKNEFGVIRTVLYKSGDNTVLFVDIDTVDGRYELYTGKVVDGSILLFDNPSFSADNLCNFIIGLDLEREYNIAKQLPFNEINLDVKLSARELLDLIKVIKADISTDDETELAASVSGMSRGNSDLLVNAINYFDMPYKSFKKMKYTRKCLKISNFTIEDVLRVLTQECMQSNINITGKVISAVCGKAFNNDTDLNDLLSENLLIS